MTMALLLLLWIGQVDITKVDLDWLYGTVYPRMENQTLKFNDIVVGEFRNSAVVVKVDGDLLHIRHKHTAALDDETRKKVVPYIAHVKKSQVVRSRDAAAYYSGRLSDHFDDVWALIQRG